MEKYRTPNAEEFVIGFKFELLEETPYSEGYPVWRSYTYGHDWEDLASIHRNLEYGNIRVSANMEEKITMPIRMLSYEEALSVIGQMDKLGGYGYIASGCLYLEGTKQQWAKIITHLEQYYPHYEIANKSIDHLGANKKLKIK